MSWGVHYSPIDIILHNNICYKLNKDGSTLLFYSGPCSVWSTCWYQSAHWRGFCFEICLIADTRYWRHLWLIWTDGGSISSSKTGMQWFMIILRTKTKVVNIWTGSKHLLKVVLTQEQVLQNSWITCMSVIGQCSFVKFHPSWLQVVSRHDCLPLGTKWLVTCELNWELVII